MSGAPANAVGLLDADGSIREWMPWAEVDRRLGDAAVTVATATRGDWQVRMLRIDAGTVAGVRLTGHAVEMAQGEEPVITEVHQGVDVRVDAHGAAVHSELRMLVPWDGEIAVSDEAATPCATVHEPPTGFPVIVAVRLGAADPAVPQIEEKTVGGGSKPMRILRTGLSIPEVELAPAPGGGHAITVLWPDRDREVVVLPGG